MVGYIVIAMHESKHFDDSGIVEQQIDDELGGCGT